jgi:hypothetical protein
MRDIDEGDPQLALQPGQHTLHADHQMRVQRRQGLVQQQHLGLGHQRARQRHPLTLAA